MAPSRLPFICANCCKSLARPSISLTSPSFIQSRAISSSAARSQRTRDAAPSQEDLPRWMKVPHRMRMPVRLRPEPQGPAWKVNTEQEPVDLMYDKFLFRSAGVTHGRTCLPDEIKWLAITHKSFEHGAMGNSDRLAFLGKRVVDLQTSLALMRFPGPAAAPPPANHVFRHEALGNIESMTPLARNGVLQKRQLAQLATGYGLRQVVRWKPRKTDDLRGSGEDTVLVHTLYSIVGAVALHRGGASAARLVRDRILHPLGFR